MSEEVARAAVEEAHAADIPVIAHISQRDDLDVCLSAGVDGAAHVDEMRLDGRTFLHLDYVNFIQRPSSRTRDDHVKATARRFDVSA